MKHSAPILTLICAASLVLAACATAPEVTGRGQSGHAQKAAGGSDQQKGHCAEMKMGHDAKGGRDGKGKMSCPMHDRHADHDSSKSAEPSAPEQHTH